MLLVYVLIAVSHVLFGIFSINHRFNNTVTSIIYTLYGILFIGFCYVNLPIYAIFFIAYIVHLGLYLFLSSGKLSRIIFLLTTYSCIFTIFLGNLLALDALIGGIHLVFKVIIILVIFGLCQSIIYFVLIPRFNKYAYKIENGWLILIISSFAFYLMLFLQSVFPYTFTKEDPLRIIIFEVSSLSYVFSFILVFSNFHNEVDYLENQVEANLLKEKIKVDQLTSLYSKSYYEEYSLALINTQEYELNNLTCVTVLDIDKFKQVNDSLGHLKGDEILKEVGKKIKEYFKNTDNKAFRFGGDEFVVITLNVEKYDLIALLESLNKDLMDNLQIKLSYGYSFVDFKDIDAVQTAFKKADKAMYKYKFK